MSLCLLMLCACSSPRLETAARTRLEWAAPPQALLLEIEAPTLNGTDNGALLGHSLDLAASLEKANAALRALRAWADNMEGE